MTPPPGFLQVDVDGLWAVRACYGKPERETFQSDPCWNEGVVRLADVFRAAGTPASFFIVGRDLEVESKAAHAGRLLRDQFELGNHSYTHRIGLTLEPTGVIVEEIRTTDKALRAIGAEPVGFRSPGYDVDTRIIRALIRCRYLYDASMLPTFAAPLLRLADAWLSRRWQPGKRQFGRVSYGRAPRGPYFPRLYKMRKKAFDGERKPIVEIPVGVTPGLRLPLTASSLFPMSNSRIRRTFRTLARRGDPVLLLLHAIDGTDCSRPIVFDNRRPGLAGFSRSGEWKEKRLRFIVEEFARHFAVTRTDHFARTFLELGGHD